MLYWLNGRQASLFQFHLTRFVRCFLTLCSLNRRSVRLAGLLTRLLSRTREREREVHIIRMQLIREEEW